MGPSATERRARWAPHKVLLGCLVAGSVGLGGLIGALIFAPGLGFATSNTQADTRGFDMCIGAGMSLDAAAEEIGIDAAELASALVTGLGTNTPAHVVPSTMPAAKRKAW
jgi:hypothetical protein